MPSFDSKSEYLAKLLQVLDLVVVTGTYIFAVSVYPLIRIGETVDGPSHYGLLPVILILFVLSRAIVFNGVQIRGQNIRQQSVCIAQEVGMTMAILVLLIFLLKLTQFSRLVLLMFGFGVTVSLIAARNFVLWMVFSRKSGSTDHHLRVLIIGSGRRARMLGDQLQESAAWGVHIVGFLDPSGKSAGRRADDEIIGHVDQISDVLKNNVVEDVVVAVPRSMLGDLQTIIDACQEEGVRLRFMADIYDFDAAQICLTQVNNIPLLSFEPVARSESVLLAKRIFDLFLTLVAMPFLLPLLVVVSAAIKIDSKGLIFFTQDRIGLHKRPFKMYKFRSMIPDAEEKMHEVEHLNEADGPNFKIENDPRVTRLGRFIRKTSIDELPQLLNVLLGDMSLVGPRPMSMRDVDLFDKGAQRKRFSVRPGITCLWQISGRSDLSFDDWLKLDIQYIESRTLWLDLKILVRTVFVVLKQKGAS